MDTRVSNETLVDWEVILLDIRMGVRYLRDQPGIENFRRLILNPGSKIQYLA